MALPFPQWFHETASALVYSLAEPLATEDRLGPPFNEVTQFVLRQHAQMPDFLRGPILAATLGFDALGGVSALPFRRQPLEARRRRIAAWRKSPVGFQRDLIRYFESLTTFALLNRENAPTPAAPPEGAPAGVLDRPLAELQSEVVVIGSGPGGAITACLLAEAGREVLLVEDGAYHALSSCAQFSQEEMLLKYRNGGQTVTFGQNKINYVEARCVGGGSEVNSGFYHRTPADVLEQWRVDYQVEGLSEAEMLPHFETCERDVSVSLLPGLAPAASRKLYEGATRLGWKAYEIPRWIRFGKEDPPEGARRTMSETYVPRFLEAGGRLLPQTRVQRLRQEGARWLLEARDRTGATVRLTAESVFVCAGAVQTPALLRRSGITRNIGNSFRVHPTVKLVAQFPEPVNSQQMGVPVHQVKQFEPRMSFGCSISTPAYLALALIDQPAAARAVVRDWEKMAIYYAAITSDGMGTVRPVPGFRDPVVRYALTENDRRCLADGLHKLAEAMFAAGASVIYPCPGRSRPLRSPADLSSLPALLANGISNLMTVHLFSSCPMGEDSTRCATDSFGRVHDLRGLYVNDASLLCTAPGVNPQGSIMALARRNALHYLAQTSPA